MQRLFSTFPDGWPGAGLVSLRAVAAIALIRLPAVLVIPHVVAAGAAALLLIGLWTPLAGVLLAVAELSLAVSHPADPWLHIILGALGAALAMLGPGAWSVDARLFGRKRIQIPQR